MGKFQLICNRDIFASWSAAMSKTNRSGPKIKAVPNAQRLVKEVAFCGWSSTQPRSVHSRALLFRISLVNHTAISPPKIPPACDTATGLPNNPKPRNPKNILPVVASKDAFPTTSTKQSHPILRSVFSRPNISIAEIAINPCATPDKPHNPFANASGDAAHDAAKLPAAAATT